MIAYSCQACRDFGCMACRPPSPPPKPGNLIQRKQAPTLQDWFKAELERLRKLPDTRSGELM